MEACDGRIIKRNICHTKPYVCRKSPDFVELQEQTNHQDLELPEPLFELLPEPEEESESLPLPEPEAESKSLPGPEPGTVQDQERPRREETTGIFERLCMFAMQGERKLHRIAAVALGKSHLPPLRS